MLHFFLTIQKLYLKLTFVNLEQIELKFQYLNKRNKLNKMIRSLTLNLSTLYNRIVDNLRSLEGSSFYIKLLLILKFKKLIKISLQRNKNLKLSSLLNSVASIYNKTQQYNHYKYKLRNTKTRIYADYTDEHFNNIGWFNLMEYLVPRFVQSGYEIFMRKDFVNKFLINPFIYKKYLSELTRAETFIQFSEAIMNYKQQRGMHKYFIHLYRQRYRKVRHKPFDGLGSYYRVTHRIMSFLLNRPTRRYKFHFSSHRFKLFQNKLIKALYKVKKTKDATNIIKKNVYQDKFLQSNTYNIFNWITDAGNNLNKFTVNGKTITKDSLLNVGDHIQPKYLQCLSGHEAHYFYRLIHFYTNLFPLFDNDKLTLFKAFGKYHFFLDSIKYKLGYILCKHLKENTHQIVAYRKKKNILPVCERNQIYYVHIGSSYLYFNQRYIYMGEPFDLEKANLDEFYRYRFSLYKGKPIPERKDSLLEFLNFHQYQLPYFKKIYHNRYHIVRYVQFIKAIKQFITMNFNHSYLIGTYSILITNNESKLQNHILNTIRNKLHLNKVEELIVGSDNYTSIKPKYL